MIGYYDHAGNPIDLDTFGALMADGNAVATTSVGDVWVSTIWLGIDHSFGAGPPLLFETMVFGGPLDEECERYATEEQARAGHDVMVARVRAATSGASS